ncbi:cupin domain-containing protein [Winogradskyella tangerina]|uniref:cupin domain-containing protein n=1 Tax=Winogradskyella tangerina TaxID=2023240 RepID=UPI000DBE80D8|nr:cupin domain-containing protein [Winogradskyella tangerina]
MNSIETIIKKLDLKPHPEGGYFKETYRSKGIIQAESLDTNYKGNRHYSTCIYFLLTSERFSALHRIKQDEIWHFYKGSPIRLHIISEEGDHSEYIIGDNLSKGQVPQLVVPGGNWFAAEIIEPDAIALVGCTVSPGFDFEDFELRSGAELTKMFPHLESTIKKLTYH